MSKKAITKLKKITKEGGSTEQEHACIEIIIDEIDKAANEENFYSLENSTILYIIKNCQDVDASLMMKIVNNLSKCKPEEAPLILNAIDPSDYDYDNCINIVSCLECSQLCVKINKCLKESSSLPEKDYEHCLRSIENEKLLIEEIEKIEKEPYEKKLAYKINDISEMPNNFEEDLFKAVKTNNLLSVQYLIKYKKVDPDMRDKDKYTPLHFAASFGFMLIVRFLVEEADAEVDAKNKLSTTPLMMASLNNQLDIVKYLVEECSADINLNNDNDKNALRCAIGNNNKEIIKYLVEKCDAKFNDIDIQETTISIQEYLTSMKPK